MAISFKFYHDSALTEEVTSGNPLAATQDTAGVLDPVDIQVWFGSTQSGNQVQATSDPGVDYITVSIIDADDQTGESVTDVKLATTQGGLDTAVAGDPLDLATAVESGTTNAVAFWVRLEDSTAVAGTYSDLALETNDLTESAV